MIVDQIYIIVQKLVKFKKSSEILNVHLNCLSTFWIKLKSIYSFLQSVFQVHPKSFFFHAMLPIKT